MNQFESVVTWIFAIIGFVTSVIQIWKWISGTKVDRGIKILAETLADEESADEASRKFTEIEVKLEDLKKSARQIARRMHIEQRKADLEKVLASSWVEYAEVVGELGQPPVSSDLPDELVDALVSDIEPRYVAERKEARLNRNILIALAVVLLLPLPFTPRSAITLAVEFFMALLVFPGEMGNFAYISGPALTLIGGLCGIAAGLYLVRRLNFRIPHHVAKVSVVCVAVVLVIGNFIAGWGVYNTLNWDTGNFTLASWVNGVNLISAIAAGALIAFSGMFPRFLRTLRTVTGQWRLR